MSFIEVESKVDRRCEEDHIQRRGKDLYAALRVRRAPGFSGTTSVDPSVSIVEIRDTSVVSATIVEVLKGVFSPTGHCGSSGRDPFKRPLFCFGDER